MHAYARCAMCQTPESWKGSLLSTEKHASGSRMDHQREGERNRRLALGTAHVGVQVRIN